MRITTSEYARSLWLLGASPGRLRCVRKSRVSGHCEPDVRGAWCSTVRSVIARACPQVPRSRHHPIRNQKLPPRGIEHRRQQVEVTPSDGTGGDRRETVLVFAARSTRAGHVQFYGSIEYLKDERRLGPLVLKDALVIRMAVDANGSDGTNLSERLGACLDQLGLRLSPQVRAQHCCG